MGISEKLAAAKKTNWLSEGISDSELKSIVELAKISGQIELRRLDLGMTQKEFAEYMGVTQGMVSKWESREYNFTIKSLNEICAKLNLELSLNIEQPSIQNDYEVSKWTEGTIRIEKKNNWVVIYNLEEAIA